MKRIIVLALLLPFFAVAQEKVDNALLKKKGVDIKKHIPQGLSVGDDAPVIVGPLSNGKLFNSTEALKEKNLVVIFYRGKWCPYCNRHLSNLNDSLQQIMDAGAEVIVVGPESFKNAEKTSEKNEVDFTLISDKSMAIMQSYDVLFSVTKKYQGKIKTFLFTNIAENNDQDEAMLPVPATYVIGKDGKIKWRHFDYDYTKRSTVSSILNALKNL